MKNGNKGNEVNKRLEPSDHSDMKQTSNNTGNDSKNKILWQIGQPDIEMNMHGLQNFVEVERNAGAKIANHAYSDSIW